MSVFESRLYLRPFSESTLKRAAETEGPGVGSRFGPLDVVVLRLLVMPRVDPMHRMDSKLVMLKRWPPLQC